MKLERQENKRSLKVYIILRALVIAVMIRQCFLGNFENVFMCGLTLILMLIPSFVQVTFRVELPTALEIIILMFIFSAEILGEVNEFYIKIPGWDTLLHTLNGFLVSLIDKIPSDGETFRLSAKGYCFEVLLVEDRVIKKVKVTKEEPVREEQEQD